MRVIYLAHPLGAPTREGIEANRRSAATWAAWVSVRFLVAVTADWIWLTGELSETPDNRAWGLECDKALVERCDELWMVGPSVSAGMLIEAEHARLEGKPVYDLTGIDRLFGLIEAALTEQGRCPACGCDAASCRGFQLSQRKCCPDCPSNHGRDR